MKTKKKEERKKERKRNKERKKERNDRKYVKLLIFAKKIEEIFFFVSL